MLWRFLATSPAVSAMPVEGQMLDSLKHVMREDPWNPQKRLPWLAIKEQWEEVWDMSKPILLEKSPPNVARAFAIEKFFRPAYYIAMVRDPYAFCEGRRRRHPKNIELSAEFWVDCATYQLQNIKGLEKVIHFRYEDFTDRPVDIRNRILEFLPALQDLDVTQSFEARSIQGRGAKQIRNFNQEKIDRLTARDIKAVNSVLREHDHLMTYFGYEYLEPTVGQSLRYLRSTAAFNTQTIVDKGKRFLARRFNR
ncbi:MAG: sulfotransferase [Gammaproteobacteria bacterium]|nr:sulfotransferase [Gammaproteobacteria bacterium]